MSTAGCGNYRKLNYRKLTLTQTLTVTRDLTLNPKPLTLNRIKLVRVRVRVCVWVSIPHSVIITVHGIKIRHGIIVEDLGFHLRCAHHSFPPPPPRHPPIQDHTRCLISSARQPGGANWLSAGVR